jgi:Concanavalin A-like lectin/glucanases superfamily/Domain of unknown function (DUF2341)/Fibronectin type III domain
MTIDHTKVPSTQSNFTVLVSVTDPALKTIANGGHVANVNGFDIGFYADSGGTTKLKWEVEKYDGTTGNLIAWVKIPSVSSTTDTLLYLFYGDPTITTDQSDPLNTWDSNFKAVYHLGNGTTLSATDSTGGNNGTLINSPTGIAGKINGAAHFVSASNQLISLANPGDFPVQTAWTMEAWVKPSTDGNIVLMWGGTSNNGPHMVLPGNNSWRVGFWGGADVSTSGVDTLAFHHIVGTFDGASLRLYKDGSLLAGPRAASPTASSTLSAVIGASSFWSSTFNGNIDEVHISNTNRSAAWITAEYNNQNSPGTFITMGSESCPSSTPTPTPTGTPSTTPTATPTATPPVAADDFNRPDGALGLNWAKPVASEATLMIVNNRVTPDVEQAHCYAYWIGNTLSQDQYSQVRISDVGSWNGVIGRAQSTIDQFYMAFVFAPNDYRLYLRKDGLYYSLVSGNTETWVPGDIIRMEVSGVNPVQLTLLRNGNPVLSYTDSTENLVGGSPGIGIWSLLGEHLAVDDWQGGNLGMQGILAPQTQAPSVRGNLVATALGVSQVKLSWTASIDNVGVKEYEVQRQDPGSTSFVRVRTTTGTSYTDSGLGEGSNYSYRVLVRDAKGRAKRYSGVASVITASPTIVPRTPR